MKVSCLQENLYRGLQLVRSSVGKEAHLPILSSILLTADKDGLSLNATNLEIGVHALIRGKIDQNGSIAIDAKTFSDFVGLLPKDKIDLSTQEDGVVSVKCQNFSTKIRSVNPEDFPIIPTFERIDVVCCPLNELKAALSSTIFTVSQNEARPELSGLLFHLNAADKKLIIVGTDAYRLGEKSFSISTNLTQDCDVILPVKTLQELLRIMQYGIGGNVEVFITDTQALFVCDGVEVYSKRIVGTYPDYTQIIPKQYSTKIIIDRQEFSQAVKASSIFSKSSVNDVHISVKAKDGGRGTVSIHSSNATVGENTTTIDAHVDGGDNEILLNHRYLLDGLQTIPEESVFFGIVDSTTPCVIKPLQAKDYLYLVMPIRE